MSTGKDLGDIVEGKNVKEAAKARGKEALGVTKNKAPEFVQEKAEKSQTGKGRRKRSRSIKRSRSSQSSSSKRQKDGQKLKREKIQISIQMQTDQETKNNSR